MPPSAASEPRARLQEHQAARAATNLWLALSRPCASQPLCQAAIP